MVVLPSPRLDPVGLNPFRPNPFRTWDHVAQDHPAVTPVDRHWVVTGQRLIREVLNDLATYGPENALDAVTPMPATALRVLVSHGFKLPPTTANNASHTHPAMRGIISDALHPARVEEHRAWLTGVVRRRVARIVSDLRAGRAVDLHATISQDLPLLTLARLLELPTDDIRLVKEFSAAALELFWAPLDPPRQRELSELVGSYHARLRRFIREAPPERRPFTERAFAAGFSEDDVISTMFFLLIAGQETTSQFLTLLMHRLTREPEVLSGVARGEVDVDDVAEEGLRLETPVVTWRRVTKREVRLGEVDLPRGASLVLWLAHAGRDTAVVTDGERFSPGQRGSRRHLAFGAGAHRCVGAQLARMEAQVVVGELAPLLRECQVIRAPWCPDNLSFRAPDALVVRSGTATTVGSGP